jgi:hypothetical protein
MEAKWFLVIYLTTMVPGSNDHVSADNHDRADIFVEFSSELECRQKMDAINLLGSGQKSQGTYREPTKQMMAACERPVQ